LGQALPSAPAFRTRISVWVAVVSSKRVHSHPLSYILITLAACCCFPAAYCLLWLLPCPQTNPSPAGVCKGIVLEAVRDLESGPGRAIVRDHAQLCRHVILPLTWLPEVQSSSLCVGKSTQQDLISCFQEGSKALFHPCTFRYLRCLTHQALALHCPFSSCHAFAAAPFLPKA